MSFPIFMNLVDIQIQQLKTSGVGVSFDSDFREPTGAIVSREDTVTLQGQINFGSKESEGLDRTRTGDRAPSFGWCVFEKAYIDDEGVTLKKGDKIIKVASQDVDLTLTEVRFESPLDGDFLLIYTEFEEVKRERESIT